MGYQGYVSSDPSRTWVMRVQALCARVTLTDGVLAIGKPVSLLQHGTDGDVTWQRACPKNQVLVSLSGRAGNFIDQLVVSCAPLQVSGASGSYTFSVGSPQELAPVGGEGGTAFAAASCGNSQIAFGHTGRSGQWVDALGLVCGTVVIAP